MVAGGSALQPVLEGLCRFVEVAASGCACSILSVDQSGHLQHGAAPSLPQQFNDSLHGLPVHIEILGPVRWPHVLNKQVRASDIGSEMRWSDFAWRSLALAHGIRACWSTPIRSSGGKVLGRSAIYYGGEPRAPTAQHQELDRAHYAHR